MMKSVYAIAALLLATGVLYAGSGLQGTLLAVRGGLESFPTAVIGALMSAYYAGFIAGCRIVPGMIQSAGHIRAFTALASVASACALAHALFVDPWVWAAMRAITGFAFAGLAMVLESWINERATNKNRGQILSIYRMVDLGALTAGNALLAVASPEGFELFAIVSILMSIALVPVALTRSEAPPPIQTAKLNLGKLLSVSPVGAVGAASTGLANAAFWGLAPVYVQEIGYSTADVAGFMSAVIVGAAVFQFPLGWVSDRIDRRIVLVCAVVGGLAAAGVLIRYGQADYGALVAFGFLFGGGVIPTFGLCAAHANDHADPRESVATSGGLLLLHGLGATAGALAGSAAMAGFGPAGLFYYIIAIYVALVVFTMARMLTRPAVKGDGKGVFRPAPRSPSSAMLDEGQPKSEPRAA